MFWVKIGPDECISDYLLAYPFCLGSLSKDPRLQSN